MELLTLEQAEDQGVVFDFKDRRHFKSIGGIKRSIKAEEKGGGFHPLQCAYFFPETNFRGDPGFSLCWAIRPLDGEPPVYRQAIEAFNTSDANYVRLPQTKDTAQRGPSGHWIHKFADGKEMDAEQWRARAALQIENLTKK